VQSYLDMIIKRWLKTFADGIKIKEDYMSGLFFAL